MSTLTDTEWAEVHAYADQSNPATKPARLSSGATVRMLPEQHPLYQRLLAERYGAWATNQGTKP